MGDFAYILPISFMVSGGYPCLPFEPVIEGGL